MSATSRRGTPARTSPLHLLHLLHLPRSSSPASFQAASPSGITYGLKVRVGGEVGVRVGVGVRARVRVGVRVRVSRQGADRHEVVGRVVLRERGVDGLADAAGLDRRVGEVAAVVEGHGDDHALREVAHRRQEDRRVL